MTPEQEEQVRRALAAAAHPDRGGQDPGEPGSRQRIGDPGSRRPADPPMPADVAARLDQVLEGLRAPLVATSQLGTARRAARTRRWPRVLAAAAAAAVVVGGGAAAVTSGFGTFSGSNTSSAGSAADSHTGGDSSAHGRKGTGRHPATPPVSPPAGDKAPRVGAAQGEGATAPDLHRATLRRDLEQLLTAAPRALLPHRAEQPGCSAPPVHAGEERLAVRLDGRPASLVLGVPTGGRRAARVYSCTSAHTPLRTTTVPVTR